MLVTRAPSPPGIPCASAFRAAGTLTGPASGAPTESSEGAPVKILGRLAVFPTIPPRIGRLHELAYNLWWTWHTGAQELYASIDPGLWERSEHNAVRVLLDGDPVRLAALAEDGASCIPGATSASASRVRASGRRSTRSCVSRRCPPFPRPAPTGAR